MAEHIEVAKAYVTIVPSLEGSQKTIAEELGASGSEAAKSAGEQAGAEFGNSLATGLKATAAVVAAAMAAVAGAAVAAGKAFIESANDVAEWGNTIDKESQKMNMTAAGYQEWAFILEHAGASIDGMKTAMKKLTVAAEEGNDAFTALGISQEDLANMTPEETWNATIEALQQVTDEGERTALASELLGKGAVELAPLFNMTAEETAALKDQVYELGGVMSDDAVKAAAEYEDQLQNMQTALKGLKNNIMSQFLPGMSSVMSGLGKLFSGNGGLEEIQQGLEDITGKLSELSPQFVELASAIVASLLDAFGPMLPELLGGIFGFLNDALTGLVALIPSLLPVITQAITSILATVFQCLPLILTSLMTLITDVATWLASGDNVKTFADGLVKMITMLVKQFGLLLPILLPAVVDVISEIGLAISSPENMALILDAVLVVIGGVVMAIADCIPVIIDYIAGLISNIIGQWQGLFSWIGPNFTTGLNQMLSIIQNIGNAISSWLSGFVSSTKNTITNWTNSVKATVVGWINGIQTTFGNWLNNLKNSFSTAFNTIQNVVGQIVANVAGFVSNCVATLSALPSEAVSIGQNLVKGLWNGISDKVDWVCDKIKGMGKDIEKAIKKVFGIASPSKVFAEIGDYLAQGLGVGFEDGMGDVNADMVGQMEDLTASMTAEVNANGIGGAATVGDSTTINGAPISINVYGAEGQDVNSLAEVIAEKLEDMTARKGAVYA